MFALGWRGAGCRTWSTASSQRAGVAGGRHEKAVAAFVDESPTAPPTRVATTGSPAASASMIDSEKPSAREGSTKTSLLRSRLTTSDRNPISGEVGFAGRTPDALPRIAASVRVAGEDEVRRRGSAPG